MKYLLDTNVVIAILNDPRSKPAVRLRKLQPGDVATSSIVTHELYYGAFKSSSAAQNLARVDLIRLEVLEFDREDARHAGEIRAALSRAGQPIGPYDALIAGQARARGLTLVTHNGREFQRVQRLRVEDWHT